MPDYNTSDQNTIRCHKLRTKLILIYLIISGLKTVYCQSKNEELKPVIFQFPEYHYKETSKNELNWREVESSCEETPECEPLLDALEKTKCMRRCISSSCYKEIYAFDELERGEIDVRLNSFKGCFIQKNANRV